MWKKILKSYDYSLIAVFILLCLFGLTMVYSASSVVAVQKYEVASDYFYNRQKIFLIISMVFFIAAAAFPYKAYRNSKFLFISLFGILAVLILLLFFGKTTNNAQSWFSLGGLSIQPAEFAKLVIIIYMSAVYAKKQKYINSFNKGVIPPIVFLVLICMVIAAQPDFGTAFIIFLIGCTIIVSSGMKFKSMWKLIVLGLMIAVLLSPMLIWKKDRIFTEEKISRFTGYLDPFEHREGHGYQVVNSYLAIGSGGVTGSGLGQSVQKLGYLPEPHTDFIMAVIAEELGVFGVIFVIGGLSFIVLKGIYTAIKCKDPFGSMMAVGISSMIAIQSGINLGGVCGLIPITGVTLPFISYGGTSLMLLSISMGILVNISMFNRFESFYKE
ncbi:FtsW/RodA/SpoVE family cell cycle protein [Bacillus sp. FJAT-52991]|uniref:Probable peptidoglycan glycosyltransferase FtsW n=1 Tax=Bacillus kandeliae TaxID=3129297 RepID=A0ABZ2NA52_9BACI